jgi:DnaJ family protein C protein 27
MGDKRKSVAQPDSKRRGELSAIGPVPTRIKVLSLGSAGVGKSCLIKRFCEERFVSKYITTIGVDYGVKPVQIDSGEVRVNFWDLSGQPEFFEIRNEFYKDTQGVILVFDVASRESFEELDAWLSEAAKFGASPRDVTFVLCGNKVDKKRVVSEDEGRQFAQNRGMVYFETSAQSGQNVPEMFEYLFQTIVKGVRK